MEDLTPPPELVQQWINEEDGLTAGHIATRAAQWGADQVVPVQLHPQAYEDCCQYSEVQTRAGIRADLLAIAAELEDHA